MTKEPETEIEIRFNFNQQDTIFILLSKFNANIINFYSEESARLFQPK
ncbi:hypothetical protein [Chryseobacterium gregarium]|nr:hypothetical protein [Chryseobacterium gregarium]